MHKHSAGGNQYAGHPKVDITWDNPAGAPHHPHHIGTANNQSWPIVESLHWNDSRPGQPGSCTMFRCLLGTASRYLPPTQPPDGQADGLPLTRLLKPDSQLLSSALCLSLPRLVGSNFVCHTRRSIATAEQIGSNEKCHVRDTGVHTKRTQASARPC